MLRARQEAPIGERVRIEGRRRRVHFRNKNKELSLRKMGNKRERRGSSDC